MSKAFFDTTTLVYCIDEDEPRKRDVARDLLRGYRHGGAVLSTQVLQEFYVIATSKGKATPSEAEAFMAGLVHMEIVVVDVERIREAIVIQRENTISFWDALIVAAAQRAGCPVIWTEDMNHGQSIRGIRIENPFVGGKAVRESPAAYRSRRPARQAK